MFGHSHQQVGVGLPLLNAAVVSTSVLVIIDKGDDLMAQAFLNHNQPAEAAVTVFEGVDPFETDMKI